ncbi:MAG: 2,3-bisphosphoglycerate-independent phosphoglycerate mutase [Planctomycetes bacterium]|nr:2,3-bisphosphoglycerate-independent phosphoglycerate mutase [Planctomycetota bacterium]
MIDKAILLIIDGLGDRPIAALGDRTPLEAAHTPNLDRLATSAECGMMHTVGRGVRPGSDVAHLAIFGYERSLYYPGRGPIEAAGIGVPLEDGDVAMRGNLGTVDDKLEIVDRRAGRIRVVEPFTKMLDGMEIDGVTFLVKPGTAHRAVVVMRGPDLSAAITDNDPHVEGVAASTVTATDDSPSAKRTADALNQFLARAHEILKGHPDNRARRAEGLFEANYILLRGAGQYRRLPSFKERYGLDGCCIAGGGLYKGVAAFLGMTVLDCPGATGLPDTDIRAKFDLALESLSEYDFVFVHVKATDSLAEDGNFAGKKDFTERIDEAAAAFDALPESALLVVTADHSTPSELCAHSADPVPILFHGQGVRVDGVTAFGERACTSGGLGFITGADVMPQVINLLGRSPLLGG